MVGFLRRLREGRITEANAAADEYFVGLLQPEEAASLGIDVMAAAERQRRNGSGYAKRRKSTWPGSTRG